MKKTIELSIIKDKNSNILKKISNEGDRLIKSSSATINNGYCEHKDFS